MSSSTPQQPSDPPRADAPSRQEIETEGRKRIIRRATSWISADVYIWENGDSTRRLIKDVAGRPFPFRILGGRVHIRHEYHTLRRLDGIPGIPRLHGMIDADALAVEFIDAQTLSDRAGEMTGEEMARLFKKLHAVLDALHRAGVAHGDIRARNILVDAQGNPYLIDFGTAMVRDARPTFLRRRLYEVAARIDDLTLLKLEARYCPQCLTEEGRRRLADQPWYLRVGRFLRHDVYRRLIKQKRWLERWKRFQRWVRGVVRGGAGPR